MPGAQGLRTCRTYHGPTRALVALRVLGLSERVQRGHGVDGSKCSVISRVSPQKGQTCPSALSAGRIEGPLAVGVSVTRVMSLATSNPSSIRNASCAPSVAPRKSDGNKVPDHRPTVPLYLISVRVPDR